MGNQAHRPPGLILIKHGAPLITPGMPPSQWPLAEDGRAQARAIAVRLAVLCPGRVVSSREPKAVETARIVAAELSLGTPDHDVCLSEQHNDTGPFVDQASFQNSVARMFAEASEVVMGEESGDEAYLRFAGAVERRLADVADPPLVAIAHGRVISLWVARRFGFDPFPFWRSLPLGGAVVVYDDHFEQLDP